ncbi:MAG: hypothetical protein ACR2P9_02170 [Gammaproteobacteria bacterium]
MRYKSSNKIGEGRYYTASSPFGHQAFLDWAKAADLPSSRILEPFAGSNSLIDYLKRMGLCDRFSSYDIVPAANRVKQRDTLGDFPAGFDVCITNPPWLAKNSATIRGLPYPDCRHDDLYKFALEKCIAHCGYVAILVPESFIRARIFRERLTDFVSLTPKMFNDTGHPVGLALFRPEKTQSTVVWSDSKKIGTLAQLEAKRLKPVPDGPDVRFNDPCGNVGLIALDNIQSASIRFCEVEELAAYNVKPTGRHITKVKFAGDVHIDKWNECLKHFREATYDVLLTCYKGIRKDGMYRRRLDWQLARGIMHHA